MREVDDVAQVRVEGVSKETVMERVAAVEKVDEARGKAMRAVAEKVYGWDRKFPELLFRELFGCMTEQ